MRLFIGILGLRRDERGLLGMIDELQIFGREVIEETGQGHL